ncbi:MAG: hypothetical protein ABH804_02970 [archaeon]
METDLRFPYFAIGFHSGWSSSNNSPTISLSLTNRKKVNLVNSKYIPIFEKEKVPFLIKSEGENLIGLSSGVGSSIIKINEKFYKIKRNGYRLEGFKEKIIPDRTFNLSNGLTEESSNEFGGAMSLEDAQREIKIEKEFVSKGFNVPQRTIALHKIELLFEDSEDAVALIQEIESDFRADEFCMMLLTNFLQEVYEEEFKIDLKKFQMFFPKYFLNEGLKILNVNYGEKFLHLGKIIGGIYKRIHKEGYLRGIGNSWYGNEVICPDGSIGICDLESCFSKEEIQNEELFEELKKTDIQLAITAFYESMNYFENSLASFVAIRLVEGFNIGYSTEFEDKIPKQTLEDEISKFLKIRNKVIIDD